MICYHMFLFSDFNLEVMNVYMMGHSYVVLIVFLLLVNLGMIILKEIERYQHKKRLIAKQNEWKALLMERKKHEILLTVHNQQEAIKEKLAKLDPDLVKPHLMKLKTVPATYGKKILLKTNRNLDTINEMDDEDLNDEIYNDIGNFGDLVEKSRKDLTHNFVCPPNKNPIHFTSKPADIAPLPAMSKDFKISFVESSRNRWK